MQDQILAMALAAASIQTAHAAQARPANALSFNAAVASDYRYRGISQTRLQPALQGGADFVNNPTGLYVGTWVSAIKWTRDAGGGGDAEWDIYGGKRGTITADVTYDVGALAYIYPNNGLDKVAGLKDANTLELYGQVGMGPAYAKYAYAMTNLFGFGDSRGSGYLDLGANVDAGHGITVNLHAGHQSVRHNGAASYTDWKLGATKDFGVCTLAAAVLGTNADKLAYATPVNGKFMGKTALVVTLSRTF
jgi:uncharacterized protein (TIGR02001 family)